LKEVVLNDGLREIGSNAFNNCTTLKSIAMPSSVTKIGDHAFGYCSSLREVVLNEGLEKIRRNVFQSCKSLQSITIPSTVDDIGVSACNECYNLRTIVLKEGIKRIKEYVFRKCTSLHSITIPSSVTCIEKETFDGCTNLREVVVHNDKMQIGKEAFANCSSLERFKFPRLSNRLNDIIQAGQRDIEVKMDDIAAVEWRSGELSIPAVSRQIENRWGLTYTAADVDKEKLKKVKGLITYYEVREATTLFELALWKARIDQADISIPSSDRGACRGEVPGPVKDTILQYLWPGGGIGYN